MIIFRGAVAILLASLLFSVYPSLTHAQRAPRKKRTVTSPSPGTLDAPIPEVRQDKVATRSTWSFLSLQAAEVESYLRDHPTYDGRGVIIVILDTGVDPDLTGLKTTTDGKVKIVDVQNYSGSGDIPFSEATRDGDHLTFNGTTVLTGLNKLTLSPSNGKYYYGALNERSYQNGLSDLNFNGKEDDVFGLLLIEDKTGHFVAYIDSDGDKDLAGEHALTNYQEQFSTFDFHAQDSTHAENKHLGGAVNIDAERHIASVYFDDGSHGSHVAGIAAGHDIDGATGFNGLAPGAQVVGIKFADNTAGGVTVSGSMKRGYEYAARLAKDSGKTVVVNMSFGIGSELEGTSAMDVWLDSLLEANPNLTVCVSAGNEGPGLSSVGLPGSADRVISSGAALPDDAARDLYTSRVTSPLIWDFSSRGGELAKPDVISPGTAVSTVPDFVNGDRYNGTSMSSPYTTGCVALLLSGMKQAFPHYQPNAESIKRALMLSAVPIKGATPLDQGFGMVNVPRAFDLLSKWERNGYRPKHYTIETAIPSSVHHGTAAYFRNGLSSTENARASFKITPEDDPNASARQHSIGFDAYDLRSDSPWLVPIQSSIYRRGEGSLRADVAYDASLMTTPGLYSGRVWVYPKGKSDKNTSAFELLNSVIVPYVLAPDNQFSASITLEKPEHQVRRTFFRIPTGAREVRVMLSGASNVTGTAQLFDNDGKELSGLFLRASEIPKPATLTITGENLRPGVWEIDLRNGRNLDDVIMPPITLQVTATPLDVRIASYTAHTGSYATMTLDITNGSTVPIEAQTDAEILGYERTFDTTISRGDLFTMPVTVSSDVTGIEYHLSLSREDYNQFTDITAQIVKPDSSAPVNSAFDYREKDVKISFEHEAGEAYMLLFRGGRANPERVKPITLRVRERRILSSSIGATVSSASKTLSPQQTETYDLTSTRVLPAIPDGFHFFGDVRMKHGSESTLMLPITF
jgi:tripeptidyl-peptidase-2